MGYCFVGPPGTGKSTVARLMGEVFCKLDLLYSSEIVEVGQNLNAFVCAHWYLCRRCPAFSFSITQAEKETKGPLYYITLVSLIDCPLASTYVTP